MTTATTIDRHELATGVVWLVRGIAIVAVALPLLLAEEPWSLAAPVFGPLGAVAVAIGTVRVVRATPRSAWGRPLVVLAVLAVPLRIATEVGVLLGGLGRGVATETTGVVTLEAGPWDAVALVTLGATTLGVLALARHLHTTLEGIAADRWKQVTYAWIAVLVLVPAGLATGFVEVLLLATATVVTAAALLLLSLLATYRAAEDDDLDAEFLAQ